MSYIIGQAFGLMTIICSLVMPFLKKKWQLLVANMTINLLTILNLTLIGQFGSANFLCMVAIVQSAIALPRAEKKAEPGKVETILFTILYVGFGFFGIFSAPGFIPAVNLPNLLELLPITGAVFSMLFVSTREEGTARKYLMCCNVCWAVYHTIIRSTAVFGAIFSGISCMIAILRDRKQKKTEETL
jgi:hypothetical protein